MSEDNKIFDVMVNKKFKVLFGLEAQGHIPLVEERLKTWWPRFSDKNKFKVWEDIAKEIGWIDYAACESYIKYLQRKAGSSTPNAKIQELITAYDDSLYGVAADIVDDLKELIGVSDV